jgi:hypothetical protein
VLVIKSTRGIVTIESIQIRAGKVEDISCPTATIQVCGTLPSPGWQTPRTTSAVMLPNREGRATTKWKVVVLLAS